MKNRALLAIILSFLVMLSWHMLISKIYHTDNQGVKTTESPREIKPPSAEIPLPPPSLPSPAQKQVYAPLGQFETDKLRLEFVNPGARIQKIFLKDYNLNSDISEAIFSKSFEDRIYTLQKSNGKLQFISEENGHSIVKTLTFSNNSYYIELDIVYTNNSSINWTFTDSIVLNLQSLHTKQNNTTPVSEVVFFNAEVKRKNPLGIKGRYIHPESFTGLGFRDRYSCIILDARNFTQARAYIEKYNNFIESGFDLEQIVIAPNSQIAYKSILYCGPQDVKYLKQNKLGYEEIIHYGGFDFISVSLLSVLHLFYNISRNWGLALILLSLFIYLVLYPLTLKQMHSMKQMQELQPQVEALRRAHRDNPQRLNKEIMELYRKHKANPLGGCLPMILQLPVFFGLYQALSRSIVLKGANFLWIKDLAEPDRFFVLDSPLPYIGKDINLLPILMAIAMFFQQKLTSKSTAVTSASIEQQKMMAIIFPVLFGFIFYHFPSGLALYWFFSTLLTILSQWKMLRTIVIKTN
jgi:YidC/Oxa1 family membrane protein insertase